MDKNMYGVILAGGNGSRLWPLSREMYPKQLLKLNQENTLLQSTFLRLSKFIKDKNIITIVNLKHSPDVKLQLQELKKELNSSEDYKVINEPVGRNTAPAIALSTFYILNQLEDKSADPIILVAPSDHLIKDIDKSTEIFKKGIKIAKEGYIVIFGVTPTKPDTGYGYIKTSPNKKISAIEEKAVKVTEFKEKPDLETAIKYCKSGAYFWNAGIFMFKASTILKEFKLYCPEIINNLSKLKLSEKGATVEAKDYEKIKNTSIDYCIMEHSKKIALVPFDCGWNDLGSWEAIYDISQKDSNNNYFQGNVIDKNSKNSIVYGDNRLVATIGLNNIAVIQTEDATLICDKNKTQDVKKIFEILKEKNNIEYSTHPTVYRPWGHYSVLQKGDGYLTKSIHVNPGEKLSIQMHNHRSEHWVVLSGIATIQKGEKKITLNPGESIDIPVKIKHSLQNLTDKDLEIIEVQKGDHLSEEDIIRFEDIYGRV